MKKYSLLITLIVLSCNKPKEVPKVTYDATKNQAKQTVQPSSTEIEIADLPVQMEGNRYLLHPIGAVRIGNEKRNVENSFVLSNYNRLELTGNFSNLKFQHQDSTSLRLLTDKKVKIQNVTLISAANTNKKSFLVYLLEDMDSNQDGVLDDNDIKDLYISSADGTNFKKLSADYQEIVDWKVIESKNQLYFRTLEDINKNGAFDKTDKVHYYCVDLNSKMLDVTEYNPIEITKNSVK